MEELRRSPGLSGLRIRPKVASGHDDVTLKSKG